jgi:hypothetical protein
VLSGVAGEHRKCCRICHVHKIAADSGAAPTTTTPAVLLSSMTSTCYTRKYPEAFLAWQYHASSCDHLALLWHAHQKAFDGHAIVGEGTVAAHVMQTLPGLTRVLRMLEQRCIWASRGTDVGARRTRPLNHLSLGPPLWHGREPQSRGLLGAEGGRRSCCTAPNSCWGWCQGRCPE